MKRAYDDSLYRFDFGRDDFGSDDLTFSYTATLK